MLVELTEVLQNTREENGSSKEKFKELFIRLNDQVNDLSEKIDVEINELVDNKIQAVRE